MMPGTDITLPAATATEILVKIRSADDESSELYLLARCSEELTRLYRRGDEAPNFETLENLEAMAEVVRRIAEKAHDQINTARYALEAAMDARGGAS